MGIDPPDFEGMYWEKVRQIEERKREEEARLKMIEEDEVKSKFNARGDPNYLRLQGEYQASER